MGDSIDAYTGQTYDGEDLNTFGKDINTSPLPAQTNSPVEEEEIVLQQQHPNLHEYVAKARHVSMFSIGFTLVCAIVGLTFAWSTRSSALLGYALEALVDVWSSVLVLWRFWKDPDGEGAYFEITRRREARASVGIAFTFVAASIVTSVQAIFHLLDHKPPAKSEVLLAISSTSIIILTWSCIVKLQLARVLQSTALRKDAITSGACAAMAGAILVSTSIHKTHPGVWWLDATVALVISVILGVIGVRTILRKTWWKKEFWVDSDLPAGEREIDVAHVQMAAFDHAPGAVTNERLASGIVSSTTIDGRDYKPSRVAV